MFAFVENILHFIINPEWKYDHCHMMQQYCQFSEVISYSWSCSSAFLSRTWSYHGNRVGLQCPSRPIRSCNHGNSDTLSGRSSSQAHFEEVTLNPFTYTYLASNSPKPDCLFTSEAVRGQKESSFAKLSDQGSEKKYNQQNRVREKVC